MCFQKSTAIFVLFAHKNYSLSFRKLQLNHWCHMDYFNDVLTTFLGLERVSCVAVYAAERSWISSKISSFVVQRRTKNYHFWENYPFIKSSERWQTWMFSHYSSLQCHMVPQKSYYMLIWGSKNLYSNNLYWNFLRLGNWCLFYFFIYKLFWWKFKITTLPLN